MSFLEEETEDYVAELKSSKKKPATPKKTTYEETHDLWLQKLSIAEIAGVRKLTEGTVLGHLGKLVQAGLISINEILPDDKIQALNEAFKDFDGESLTGLREKYQDEFTWDELKLFRSSLSSSSVQD